MDLINPRLKLLSTLAISGLILGALSMLSTAAFAESSQVSVNVEMRLQRVRNILTKKRIPLAPEFTVKSEANESSNTDLIIKQGNESDWNNWDNWGNWDNWVNMAGDNWDNWDN
ncbi:hypothetical protein D0962_04590 [Leptolyngbyaceae cyanobacterium CCMR0082]|uniref:Uncharacterized protein n=1 Tax=Adonisia turfae CCMR0082 TaxID=2304604 RepID=A0A6M0S0T1_9CYAN|nr:hypothetical protein [Adonisia turfae]NEZ62057.1 hypothetical protein [Adonisia turfae CCMR0082]